MEQRDPDDPQPAYQQVASALRIELRSGRLLPGTKLPSHAQLIEDYGVSLGTIKRALGVLQDEGLIVSRRGEGAFVRTKPPVPSGEGSGEVDLRETVADLARRVAELERRVHARP